MKRVLVTGSSRGIGKSIALALAQAGFAITVHCRSRIAEAQAVVEEIVAAGGTAHAVQFDVADRAGAKAVIEQEIETHGAYYGVVLNAGITRDEAFPGLTAEEWDEVIHTNLDGFFNVLHPLVMPMVRLRDGGRIVTMSSVSGIAGNRGQTNYSASKAGIIGATKSLAIELGKRGITVNAVAPGLIETEMTEHIDEDFIKDHIPLRRVGTVEEVSGLVRFLFSKEAAYITRQVLSVNGGLV